MIVDEAAAVDTTSAQVLVGPVLTSSPMGLAVAQAILEQNPNATVVNRGAYLRLLVPDRCVLSVDAVERIAGTKFELPTSLEAVMTSFQGRLRWTEGVAEWT